MTDNQSSEEVQELQDRILKEMNEFSIQNPTITEAMAAMNMTMPDYLEAIEAIRGPQVVSASSFLVSQPDEAAF